MQTSVFPQISQIFSDFFIPNLYIKHNNSDESEKSVGPPNRFRLRNYSIIVNNKFNKLFS